MGKSLSLTTAQHWIEWTARQLDKAGVSFGHGTDNCDDEAAWLVSHATGTDIDRIIEGFDPDIGPEGERAIKALLQQRIERRTPLAYLTGFAWFCGLLFEVNPHVLVPRSPIAELIAEGFQPWVRTDAVRSVLDLGTGSGCIAIACAMAFPDATVTGSDISAQALQVARRNCDRHGVQNRVKVVESDVYDSLGSGKYDLIISNPPYVPESDLVSLPPEYQAEPSLALRSGMGGLEIPLRILAGAGAHLNEGGVLVCEVGETKQRMVEVLPDVDFLWLEFAGGGEGVFLLEASQVARAARSAGQALGQP